MITYPILRLYLQNETVEFRDRDVVQATVTQEVNPLNLELPASRADITVYTTNTDFNPFSNGRYYQSLTANTAADLLINVDGTETYIGRFYLDEWNNPSEGILTFSLQDAIGVMESIPFDGIFYEVDTTLTKVISDLAIHAPTEIEIDPEVTGMVKGYIPGNINLRQALQQVCFAAGAYPSTQGSDRILIKPTALPHPMVVLSPSNYDGLLSTYDTAGAIYSDYTADGTITNQDKLDRQELKILPMVTGIELITHDYTKGTAREVIFSDTLEPGDYKIVYNKPYAEVSVWGVGDVPEALGTEDDNTVLVTEDSSTYPNVTIIGKTGSYEYGPNSISLHVTDAGPVEIDGLPYNDNTQVLSWVNPESVQAYSEGALYDIDSSYDHPDSTYWREWSILAPQNSWKITDGTLVNKTNGPTVLTRIIEYANARHEQSITALPEKEIGAGLVYILDSLYNKQLVAGVESITTNLSGGNLKESRLVGMECLITDTSPFTPAPINP